MRELAEVPGIHFITYDTIFEYQPMHKLDPERYHEFVSGYLNNHLTARLLDREGYLPKYGIGIHNAFTYYTQAAYHILSFLIEKEISFIYFRFTPHESIEWILGNAAEFLNIDVYATEVFIFPWLYTLKKGFMRHTVDVFKELHSEDTEESYRAHIRKYVGIIKGNYDNAMPSYEKNRFGKGPYKYFNPFNDPKGVITKPHKFLNTAYNYAFYKKRSEFLDLKNTNYAVFFLHYQPERTTMPEGYEFVDQVYAAKMISLLLPEGTRLLVKEHPSMFTRQSEPKFRSVKSYQLLADLPNVSLCPMELDNFSLVDNSQVVITINGTVALEAFIRKIPVITLGRSNLKVEGVHSFSTIPELQKFVHAVFSGKIRIWNIEEQLLSLTFGNSISGLESSAEDTADYYLKYDFQEVANYKLLTKLLTQEVKWPETS
ncbi:hypothetical protein A3SI_06754 [Nitritalea halalkaliphila LW7]|uniref:Capsule polysaccharide biosynthesis protein n=1 Tax=Nitritalea halalkaliphila LW7 TaxID=1189621 RepID=I5C614_9BACT|nr:hypothetical protein [Nitritalea halalkaliphila]EIM77266.1 hypothetical protein A3SI_06754 [Nitritalea halalkaliphila LW7]